MVESLKVPAIPGDHTPTSMSPFRNRCFDWDQPWEDGSLSCLMLPGGGTLRILLSNVARNSGCRVRGCRRTGGSVCFRQCSQLLHANRCLPGNHIRRKLTLRTVSIAPVLFLFVASRNCQNQFLDPEGISQAPLKGTLGAQLRQLT